MAKVLNSISLDAPAAPVSAAVDDTFAFSGTPGFTGTGGVQRYDFKWEVDSGGGYVTIAASGTGLITADANPVTNTNSQAQQSITVSCNAGGSYTIRMSGAPTSGGSYTVLSSTQTVTVSAADALLADDIATGAPTLTSPAIGQEHVVLANDLSAGAPTLTSAALGQVHALTADDVASGVPTLSSPVLGLTTPLLADDLASGTPTLTSPAVGQVHVLLADDLTSGTPTLTSAAVGQVHALTADDVATDAPTLTSPVLTAVGDVVVEVVVSGGLGNTNWSKKRPRTKFRHLGDPEPEIRVMPSTTAPIPFEPEVYDDEDDDAIIHAITLTVQHWTN